MPRTTPGQDVVSGSLVAFLRVQCELSTRCRNLIAIIGNGDYGAIAVLLLDSADRLLSTPMHMSQLCTGDSALMAPTPAVISYSGLRDLRIVTVKLPERSAVIGPVVPRVPGTSTARQVLVKEYGDRDFVDPGQQLLLSACPTRKMPHLSEVTGNGGRGVPALGQVTLERDGVRPDGTGGEPIDLDDA